MFLHICFVSLCAYGWYLCLRGINIEVAIVLLQNSEDRYSVIIRRPSLSF